jgi:DUF1680 family protein
MCTFPFLPSTLHAQGRIAVLPVPTMKVSLFPLSSVQILDGPFKDAMETDRAYLLRLDPDRLMSHMVETAGLKPKAQGYGGWDRGASGMIGHYLSAICNMSAATGDPELRRRIDYIVSTMAKVQQANGDGGLYASKFDKQWFIDLSHGNVRPMGTTPWYVMHKNMAGLRDAYLLTGSPQARQALIRLANWCVATTSKLTVAQWQEMLGPPNLQGEFGGPHEVLADVYAITGDKAYLECAEKFRHNVVFDPLLRGETSVLNGLHANTEIPKFVGYERIYELTGDTSWHRASQVFYNNLLSERTWANGGNGQWEHFFNNRDIVDRMMQTCGPETCDTYNTIKLARQFYTLGGSAHDMDYYELALYNSILSSEAPGGGFVYYTSMRPGHYRVYSDEDNAFWCCVGTGMENHGKYGELIYAHSLHRLMVNLFIPSKVTWPEEGLTVRQETTFPNSPRTALVVQIDRPKQLTLSVRYPSWVRSGQLKVAVNGRPVPAAMGADGYVDIVRTWKSGDDVRVELPMSLHAEQLTGHSEYAAFLYGPVLLAGELGTAGLKRSDFYGDGVSSDHNQLAQNKISVDEVPVMIGSPESALSHIVRRSGTPLAFQTSGLAKPNDVTLAPFYSLHFQRYAIYWRFQTSDAYLRDHANDKLVVDHVHVGEDQSEASHALVVDHSRTGSASDPFSHWRDATGSFGYTVKVLPDQPATLRCTYWGSDTGRVFDVVVDGNVIATQTLSGAKPNGYLDVDYPLPLAFTTGKSSVTVRFQAHATSTAGGLFDLKVLEQAG